MLMLINNSLRCVREVVTELIEEYKAAERPDYVSWGPSSSASAGGGDAV